MDFISIISNASINNEELLPLSAQFLSSLSTNITKSGTNIVWEDDICLMLPLVACAEHLIVGDSTPICSVDISPAMAKASGQFF